MNLTDMFRRFYNYPVQCQTCQRAFSLKRLNQLYDRSSQSLTAAAFDRSVSAHLVTHAIRCPACRSQMLLPGHEPVDAAIDLTCPTCTHIFTHHSRHGHPSLVGMTVALLTGVMAGLVILFLDEQGHIAVDRLTMISWIKDNVTHLQTWASKIRL